MVMFLAVHPMESIISQLIRFARASSSITDFNTRNKLLTIGIINFSKPFLKFIDDTII